MVSKAYKGALRSHPPLPLVLKAHPVSPPIEVKSGGERVMVGLEDTMGGRELGSNGGMLAPTGDPYGPPGLPMVPKRRLPGGPYVRREKRRKEVIPPAGLRHLKENEKN